MRQASLPDHRPIFPDGLLTVLARGPQTSPQALALALGVPEATVRQGLNTLRDLGLALHEDTHGLIHLDTRLDVLDERGIQAGFDDPESAPPIQVLEQVDSTSAWLDRARQQGARGPLACCADVQTAGRGRRGRQWLMPPCAGLALSLLWDTASWPGPDPTVTLATGAALVQCLESLGAQGLGLKWPNDIQMDGLKLGGILVEGRLNRGGGGALILGVGLNLRLPGDLPIDQPYADLHRAGLDPLPDRSWLAGRLLQALIRMLETYPEPGFEAWQALWQDRDVCRGRAVTLAGDPAIEGIAQGVDAAGRLCVETASGQNWVEAGEVSLRVGP
ncbi:MULTISPECIES: biotin--[acetyl-CoA-carboxylase] ligase [unclassified Ectothiorhodospira]|uniref:biotin--[acetyl-CoA-carboxylase] ligase n=1 Tax=unclassified Ectothiorhodospira TaxID=2684909 RepID=UPI001EE90B96|nr:MULTISPECIES: biotin--[acetyl-CoA-carboxylase] ligase [unclassified Ectothiorhodospira]MCG5515302.1 biotin--[acetyl-CoA-carboxylase] ligase [Ectothiorhodospira sp. 9100]MCG5519417.1 biotin--[acetyl-CoA-carboxylase] ligase [Ectothiorhodospira sp. 9905]